MDGQAGWVEALERKLGAVRTTSGAVLAPGLGQALKRFLARGQGCLAAHKRHAALPCPEQAFPGKERRLDAELAAASLGPRLLKDVGLEPPDRVGRPGGRCCRRGMACRRNSSNLNRKEDSMAPEMTPRTWPSQPRGLADDAAALAGLGTRLGSLTRGLAARLAPWGRVLAGLNKGQTVFLDGSRLARVECLEGTAWVTCASDGRDIRLDAGGTVTFPGPGQVAVTAMDGPARVRLGWR